MNPDVVIVSNHCAEDLSWLHNQEKYKFVVCSKTNPNSHIYLPKNAACEVEAYLTYIVQNYDSLPQTVVFVHGHEYAWHQNGTVMQLLEQLGDLTKYKCENINNRWCCMVTYVENWDTILNSITTTLNDSYTILPDDGVQPFRQQGLWRRVLGVDTLPPYIYSRVCAQFVVHRDVIRSRPLEYWKRLLDTMYELCTVHDSKAVAILFEVLWFYIFTNEYDEGRYDRIRG